MTVTGRNACRCRDLVARREINDGGLCACTVISTRIMQSSGSLYIVLYLHLEDSRVSILSTSFFSSPLLLILVECASLFGY
jgi:ferredoxin-thioredoxin reductase catalytic subunit